MADEKDEKDEKNVVEIDGNKFLEDPDDLGKALKGEDGNPIPFIDPSGDDDEGDAGDDDADAGSDDDDDDDDDSEPIVRRSHGFIQNRIIERKNKKIDKIEKKDGDGGDDASDDADDAGDAGDDDSDLTAKGRQAVSDEVESQVKPITDNIKSQADEGELKDLFAHKEYGEKAKEMEKQIRKYMGHKAYAGSTIEMIFLGLAAKKYGIGGKAAKVEEANVEAEAGSLGGGTKRKKPKLSKIPDTSKMTDEQQDKLSQEIQSGEYKDN